MVITSSPLTIASLLPADRGAVRMLLQSKRNAHVHLDWRSLKDRLSDPNLICWVAHRQRDKRRRDVVACVGAAPVAGFEGHAWLRLAALADETERDNLDKLWERLYDECREHGIQSLSALALGGWIEGPLTDWGFARTNAVVTLRHSATRDALPVPASITLRDARRGDLPTIARLDAAAFEPRWHHAEADLQLAFGVATTFEVAQINGDIVGYQLSTRHAGSGHLARLAVEPAFQQRGIGKSLVSSALTFFHRRGVREVTVNTQQDNLASHHLYETLGFRPTHHMVPVWTRNL